MVSMMSKIGLSILCVVLAEESEEESVSMLQKSASLSVIPDGEIGDIAGDINEGSESKQEASAVPRQYTMSYSLLDDSLWASVDGPDHAVFVQMQEYSLLKTNRISFLSVNGTTIEQAPSFRTFRAVDGPGRVQLNEDGTLLGWFELGGQHVRLTQDPAIDSAHVQLLSYEPLPSDLENNPYYMKYAHEIVVSEDGQQIEVAVETETDTSTQSWGVPQSGLQHESAGLAVEGNGGHAPQNNFKASWNNNGQRWYGGGSCFPGDDSLWEMNIGILVDYKATQEFPDWQAKIAGIVNEASTIYENQLHIDLKIGFWLAPDSAWSSPQSLFGAPCSSYDLSATLNNIKTYFSSPGATFKYENVATAHMFTGCKLLDNLQKNCKKWEGATCVRWGGTVGLAWIGTLCQQGMGGVDMLNNGWRTFAHELGHNFGARHSFENGQGTTGGIMDYGTPAQTNFNGIPQFNTHFRKAEVCSKLKERLPKCSQTAFHKKSGTVPVPVPVPNPVPPVVPVPGPASPAGGTACAVSPSEYDKLMTSSIIRFTNLGTEESWQYCVGECASRATAKSASGFIFQQSTGTCSISVNGYSIEYSYSGSGYVMYTPRKSGSQSSTPSSLSLFSVVYELAGAQWKVSTKHSDYNLSLEDCAKTTVAGKHSFFIYPGDIPGFLCSIAETNSVDISYGTGALAKVYRKKV